MPRLSDGNYVLPTNVNPVETQTPITSTWANTTMEDVGATLTDCLDTEGRNAMAAPFKFANGSVSAPSITWGNDPSSGWYLASAADMRVSLSGVDVFRVQGGQAQVFAGGVWNNLLYSAGSGSIPDGTAAWQTVTWNNSVGAWTPTSDFTINDATGAVSAAADMSALTFTENGTSLVSKYLGINDTAANSAALAGFSGTYYTNADNLSSGTVNPARLTGTYTITVNGNASTATTAANSTLFDGNNSAYYRNATNLNSGFVPAARLAGQTYNITNSGSSATSTLAANSTKWGNYNIVVGAAGTDPNTIYFVI